MNNVFFIVLVFWTEPFEHIFKFVLEYFFLIRIKSSRRFTEFHYIIRQADSSLK